MRRSLLEGTRCFITPLELQRYSVSTITSTNTNNNNNNNNKSEKREYSKRTMSFGIDQSKLNLSLNLHEADFSAMVKATKAAMAKEKILKDSTNIEVTISGDVMNETKERNNNLNKTIISTSTNNENNNNNNNNNEWRKTRTIRGIVGAGAAHDTNSMKVVKEQRISEGARFTLIDALRDCILAGNWLKAMRFFESAIETSCKNIQLTSSTSTSTSNVNFEINKMNEFQKSLESLRRINATTPPDAFTMNMPIQQGILRWSGGHYYLLLKLLLSKFRIKEAEKVWEVMKRIGFVEYHMNAQTINNCMNLARKNNSSDLVFQLSEVKNHVVEEDKTFRRNFVMELEEWAKKKELVLDERNKKTVYAVRLASIVNNNKENNDNDINSNLLDGDGLKVGDFSGLLRRCTSEESTNKVLAMMEKINISRDVYIYSALIAALRQPHYKLNSNNNNNNNNSTKEEYDAYRKRRLEKAREWFNECPQSERTADIYNEMLHITRGGKEEKSEFEQLLQEFRGAPVSLLDNSEQISIIGRDNNNNDNEIKDNNNNNNNNNNNKQLTPPRWRTPPNGRTYEIIISYYKYLQKWDIIWALYNEMMERNVKGTNRLYQMLLETAERHPPQGQNANIFVLELYEDMKQRGINVTSIKSTVSVVNAWSATRRRRKW